MTRVVLKKYWIALISTVCIGGGIALACADGWGEEYGTSNFSPEVFVDSAYSPFFYSDQFYYLIGHDESQHTRFNDENVKAWSGWFNNQLTKDELQYLLETATPFTIDSAVNYTSRKTAVAPGSIPSIKKLQANEKLAAFLTYLRLAKKSEAFALNDIPSPWGADSTVQKTSGSYIQSLAKELQQAFSASTDAFLKERYWFQLLRSYFFNGQYQQAVNLFAGSEQAMPHNTMYFRTMAYAAGAYYKQKNFSRANYYYSRVYDSCDALKTTAHYSFHPQEETDWNGTLALCRNNNEKASLWQMLGIFYSDEQRAIQEIYQINPSSDKLDLLLARSINKYEQKFGQRASMYSSTAADSAAMQTLPALVTKIATAANTGKPWVWQMAAGYINTLDKKYQAAGNWFATAAKSMPATKAGRAQLRLLKMINTIGQAKQVDDKLEKQVLTDIEWLNSFDGKRIPELRYADAFDWLKRKMADKYRQQKEFVKAECFASTAAFYTTDKNIEDLKTFLGKKDKTAYEKLCTSLCIKKMDDLFEFQAIKLTYADSILAAIDKMEKAGAPSGTVLPGNPFNGRIQDCHDCDHAAAQKIKYTKLSFLKKLQEISGKLAAGEDVYTNAMLLANAFYNISHFGNARFFYEGKITGEAHSSPYYIDEAFRKMLTGTGMAEKYYNTALGSATNNEQKAKCQYMLAKCQRNQWYNTNFYSKKDNLYAEGTMVNLNALNGFKALKQYAGTQYYKEVIKECGYFKMYTGK